jgi:hypothetical protein
MAIHSGDLLGDDTKDRYLRSDLLAATLPSNREVDVTFYRRRTKIFLCPPAEAVANSRFIINKSSQENFQAG